MLKLKAELGAKNIIVVVAIASSEAWKIEQLFTN